MERKCRKNRVVDKVTAVEAGFYYSILAGVVCGVKIDLGTFRSTKKEIVPPFTPLCT